MTRAATFTPLRQIPTPGGDIRHGLKAEEESFAGFGEAYFSLVDKGFVKGWKRHNRMTLNLIVPIGLIQFRVVDDVAHTSEDFLLGPDAPGQYGRLTVPPGLWLAFGGVGEGCNMLLNVASLQHDPLEADRTDMDAFAWDWTVAS